MSWGTLDALSHSNLWCDLWKKEHTLCKDPIICCRSKRNRAPAGVSLVKWHVSANKLLNLNNLILGDEVNNAIKIYRLYLLRSSGSRAALPGGTSQLPQVSPHWRVLSHSTWAGWVGLGWWQQSPDCSNLTALQLEEAEQLLAVYELLQYHISWLQDRVWAAE